MRRLLMMLTLLTLGYIGQAAAQTQYTFQTIDVPFDDVQVTEVKGLNNTGMLTGQYADLISVSPLSFLKIGTRYTILPFVTTSHINHLGHLTGWYHRQPDGVKQGFLHTGEAFVPIFVPGSRETEAVGLNDHGGVVGHYLDAQGLSQSFLYNHVSGRYDTLQIPFPSGIGSGATAINGSWQIVGWSDNRGYRFHVGVVTPIDVPGAVSTLPHAINRDGVIAGTYFRPDGRAVGFTRTTDRGSVPPVFTTVEVPGSVFTAVFAINNRGKLAGTWYGADGMLHGFIATPIVAPRVAAQ